MIDTEFLDGSDAHRPDADHWARQIGLPIPVAGEFIAGHLVQRVESATRYGTKIKMMCPEGHNYTWTQWVRYYRSASGNIAPLEADIQRTPECEFCGHLTDNEHYAADRAAMAELARMPLEQRRGILDHLWRVWRGGGLAGLMRCEFVRRAG